MRRNPREKIDLGGEQVDAEHPLQKLPDRLDVLGKEHTQDKPGERADDADRSAAQDEDAQHHAARGAHRAQDGYVAALVLHHHDHAGDDVEGGDQDDQRQDQEHHVALDLDGIDDARIGVLPVEDADMAAERGRYHTGFLTGMVGVGDEDFELADLVGHAEEQLRRGKRDIDEAVVVFVEADV